MRTWLVLTTLLFTTSCAGAASECAWVRRISIDPKDSLSRTLAQQIVAHNRKVEEFCR
jgi:hypothetical protein